MCEENLKIELDNIIKKYYENIRFIDSAFDIYISMKYEDTRWNTLYAISPVYFTIVRSALKDFFILGLTKLYEKESRSDYNLNRFIKYLKKIFKSNRCVYPKIIEDFEESLDENQKQIKNLMTHRDQSIAHNDERCFLEVSKLNDDAPLSINAIRDLIKKTLNFIGNLNYYVSKEITFSEFYDKDDYKKLFARIERTNQ